MYSLNMDVRITKDSNMDTITLVNLSRKEADALIYKYGARAYERQVYSFAYSLSYDYTDLDGYHCNFLVKKTIYPKNLNEYGEHE